MSSGVDRARKLVEESLYHNAEDILEQIVEIASIHPDVTDEEFDELTSHYSEFCDEVDSRYTNQPSLMGELSEMEDIVS